MNPLEVQNQLDPKPSQNHQEPTRQLQRQAQALARP